jgi:subtilase family serine protease
MKPALRRLQPSYTSGDGSHELVPGDIGVIYDINPLYAKSINGSGQKIAVMGQTRVDITDIESFRTNSGLPANDPQMILVPGSADPGITGDQGEADLDLDWSGTIAPNASILFVYSTNVDNSVMYAVDQSLAPIISYSYGGCEPEVSGSSASSANAYRSIAQQANAQGITWLASSWDQEAACDFGKIPAKNGLAVNLPASVPEVTGVGGTEFNEGSGHYWNSTSAANGTSALSYIPEMAWNDTLVAGTLAATGAGMSIFFSKPVWQTGSGVQPDGARDVPDLSFAAANDHDPYIVITGGEVQFVGGTSVATPVFPGILALLNQYLVANGGKAGLGNINPNLYSLAQNTPGIFHDITVGTNEVPCQIGTLNCNSGSIGYNTGVGYNMATGLGSADAYNLVTEWNAQPTTRTTMTVTANPANILITASTSVTATVKAVSGTTTPAGSVSFSVGNTSLGTEGTGYVVPLGRNLKCFSWCPTKVSCSVLRT